MTDVSGKLAIREYALFKPSWHTKAIKAHRESIAKHGLQPGNPYFDFMSEVDNPCPDLGLRAKYRRALLALPVP